MSENHTHTDTTHTDTADRRELNIGRLAPAMGLIGIIGIVISLVLLFSGGEMQHQMAGSYMFGWSFWFSLTLGMFGLTILHHTLRTKWTLGVFRLLEAGGGYVSLLLLALLFLPILFNMHWLYEWARPEAVAHDRNLQWKAPLLNMSPAGFPLRFVLYFGLWSAYAWGMRNSARRQEATGNFKLELGRSSWGAAGIVFYFLSVTSALTDFIMSMEPHWFSTMYGTWQMVAAAGGALAFAYLIMTTNATKMPYRSFIYPDYLRDCGNMLFVCTMLWGYTSLAQFLIIWNANIPEQAQYYARRSSMMHPAGMEANSWGVIGLILILGRFFIPFFALITPRMKKTPLNLAKVCGWVFVMHIVEVYLLVVPAIEGRAQQGPITPALLTDALAFVSIGGLWMCAFALQASKAKLLPSYDTRLQEAKAHAH